MDSRSALAGTAGTTRTAATATKPNYDVFISHAGTEKLGIVSHLDKALRLRGFKVFVDWRMTPSTDAPNCMLEEASTAFVGLCVLSPTYFKRKWPTDELKIFLDRRKNSAPNFFLVPFFYLVSTSTKITEADAAPTSSIDEQAKVSVEDQQRLLNELSKVTGLVVYEKDHREADAVEKVCDYVASKSTPSFLNNYAEDILEIVGAPQYSFAAVAPAVSAKESLYVDQDIARYREAVPSTQSGYRISRLTAETSVRILSSALDLLPPTMTTAEHPSFVALLGDPGFGKSSTFQYALIRWSHAVIKKYENCESPDPGDFPVLVSLAEYERNSTGTIFDYVCEGYHAGRTPIERTALEYLLREKHVLLMLDGLDEVSDGMLSFVHRNIELFIRTYLRGPGLKHVRIVISTRSSDAKNLDWLSHKRFEMYVLQGFNEVRQRTFLDNWHNFMYARSDSDFKNSFHHKTRILKQLSIDSGSRELARTPFLLAIMATLNRAGDRQSDKGTKGSSGVMIGSQAELYKRCIEHIVGLRKDALKAKSGKLAAFEAQRVLLLLCDIAKTACGDDALTVTSAQASAHAVQTLVREHLQKHFGTREYHPAETQYVIEQLVTGYGLLRQTGDSYYFLQQTLLDFFLAMSIYDEEKQKRFSNLSTIVKSKASNARWQEVIVLLVGLLPAREARAVIVAASDVDELFAGRCAASVSHTEKQDRALEATITVTFRNILDEAIGMAEDDGMGHFRDGQFGAYLEFLAVNFAEDSRVQQVIEKVAQENQYSSDASTAISCLARSFPVAQIAPIFEKIAKESTINGADAIAALARVRPDATTCDFLITLANEADHESDEVDFHLPDRGEAAVKALLVIKPDDSKDFLKDIASSGGRGAGPALTQICVMHRGNEEAKELLTLIASSNKIGAFTAIDKLYEMIPEEDEPSEDHSWIRSIFEDVITSRKLGLERAATLLARKWPDDQSRYTLLRVFSSLKGYSFGEVASILCSVWPDSHDMDMQKPFMDSLTSRSGADFCAAFSVVSQLWPELITPEYYANYLDSCGERSEEDGGPDRSTISNVQKVMGSWRTNYPRSVFETIARSNSYSSYFGINYLVENSQDEHHTMSILEDILTEDLEGAELACKYLIEIFPDRMENTRMILLKITSPEGAMCDWAIKVLARTWRTDETAHHLLDIARRMFTIPIGEVAIRLLYEWKPSLLTFEILEPVAKLKSSIGHFVLERVCRRFARDPRTIALLRDTALSGDIFLAKQALMKIIQLDQENGKKFVIDLASTTKVAAQIAVQVVVQELVHDDRSRDALMIVLKKNQVSCDSAMRALAEHWREYLLATLDGDLAAFDPKSARSVLKHLLKNPVNRKDVLRKVLMKVAKCNWPWREEASVWLIYYWPDDVSSSDQTMEVDSIAVASSVPSQEKTPPAKRNRHEFEEVDESE